MFCYVRTGFTLSHVSLVFLFSRFESSSGITYIAPVAVCAINLVYDVGLFFGIGSGLSFSDGKRCSKVLSGFVVVLMPYHLSSLFRGSVEPLM
jgi:hypothetical protein